MTKRQRFDPKEIRNVILDLRGLTLGVEFQVTTQPPRECRLQPNYWNARLRSVSVVVKQN